MRPWWVRSNPGGPRALRGPPTHSQALQTWFGLHVRPRRSCWISTVRLMFHLQSDEPPSAETLSAYCQQLGLSQRGEGRFSMLDAEGQVVFSTMPPTRGCCCHFCWICHAFKTPNRPSWTWG